MSNFGSAASGTQTSCTLPFFGSNVDIRSEAGTTAFNGGSNVTHTTLDNSAGSWGDMKMTANPGITLGLNTVVHTLTNGGYRFIGYQIATPIHTSSHYQTFETPYLHELVGGDRNMEQNNLVVTADGKTWDEVTRDTSYLGNTVVQANCDAGEFVYNVVVPFDEWRGFNTDASYTHNFNKDFAIAYDRVICLVDAEYEVTLNCLVKTSGSTQHARVVHNSSDYSINIVLSISTNISGTNEYNTASQTATVFLKRVIG